MNDAAVTGAVYAVLLAVTIAGALAASVLWRPRWPRDLVQLHRHEAEAQPAPLLAELTHRASRTPWHGARPRRAGELHAQLLPTSERAPPLRSDPRGGDATAPAPGLNRVESALSLSAGNRCGQGLLAQASSQSEVAAQARPRVAVAMQLLSSPSPANRWRLFHHFSRDPGVDEATGEEELGVDIRLADNDATAVAGGLTRDMQRAEVGGSCCNENHPSCVRELEESLLTMSPVRCSTIRPSGPNKTASLTFDYELPPALLLSPVLADAASGVAASPSVAAAAPSPDHGRGEPGSFDFATPMQRTRGAGAAVGKEHSNHQQQQHEEPLQSLREAMLQSGFAWDAEVRSLDDLL